MRRFVPISMPLLMLLCFCVFTATLRAQDSEKKSDGVLIVIFSTEKEAPRTAAAQGMVWNSFVAKLKKSGGSLEVINEIAINDEADKNRAFELAAEEKKRHTVWLRFSGVKDLVGNPRGDTVDLERLIARYVLFAPASKDIIGEGEVEQDRVRESEFETYTDHKAMRASSGKVTDTTPSSHRQGPVAAKSPKVMDANGLKKVGEQVAEKVVAAIRNFAKRAL